MKSFFLATATELVEFRLLDKSRVIITTNSSVGPWPKYPAAPKTVGIDQARAEYRRLLANGYQPW